MPWPYPRRAHDPGNPATCRRGEHDILANTNLRVALRVQSKEDSSNVIEVPDAASIERSQMGRAYINWGKPTSPPFRLRW